MPPPPRTPTPIVFPSCTTLQKKRKEDAGVSDCYERFVLDIYNAEAMSVLFLSFQRAIVELEVSVSATWEITLIIVTVGLLTEPVRKLCFLFVRTQRGLADERIDLL